MNKAEELRNLIASKINDMNPVIPLVPKELAIIYVLLANGNRGMSVKEIEEEISRIFNIPRHKMFSVRHKLYSLMQKGWLRRERKGNRSIYYVKESKLSVVDILHYLLEIIELRKKKT